MSARVLTGLLGGVACVLLASAAHAECTTDNECPGELVCEDGDCVAAPPAPPPSAPRVAAPAAPAPAPAPAPPVVTQSIANEPAEPEEAPRAKPKGKRHSTGMMVGGIVITSFSPISFAFAMLGALCGVSIDGSEGSPNNHCDGSSYFVGGMAVTGVLLGVGIPLIVVGARRDGAPTARLAPWVTPDSAGLGLRFDL